MLTDFRGFTRFLQATSVTALLWNAFERCTVRFSAEDSDETRGFSWFYSVLTGNFRDSTSVDCVREVHSSIFGLGQRRRSRFSWFYSVLTGNFRDSTSNSYTSASFRIFSNSLFTDHPDILPYIL
jgi:hypothetical protein